MSYLVRKISRRENIDKIKNTNDIKELDADVIMQEFRTAQNAISTWSIDELNNNCINQAVLAIATASSDLETMHFIIINTDYLEQLGLDMNAEKKGDTPVEDLREIHRDITNLKYGTIDKLIIMYNNIASENDADKYIITKKRNEIKLIVKQALSQNRINIDASNDHIRPKLIKLIEQQ